MKRIVLYILFWGSIVWGWHTVGENVLSMEKQMTEEQMADEVERYKDPMIDLLMEANCHADVSIRPVHTLPTHFARRHRLERNAWDNLSAEAKTTQNSIWNHLYKSFHELSLEHAALLKGEGYYVYALRKIVV